MKYQLNIEIFEKGVEMGDTDWEHIESMIQQGYTSGELNIGEEEVRGWWSIKKDDND